MVEWTVTSFWLLGSFALVVPGIRRTRARSESRSKTQPRCEARRRSSVCQRATSLAVGLTEQQAKEKGYKVNTALLHLKDVPRAQASRDLRGLIKLVAEEETGRLLGAHILAAEAGDAIQEATLAIRFGMTVKDIADTFHPYLTMVEGIKLAALTFTKDVAFLDNTMRAMTGTTGSVAVVSLPRSQIEMTDYDQQWLDRINKSVHRVSKDLIANDESEISEVVRRRLFEDLGKESVRRSVAKAYAEWCFDRRNQLPPEWTAVDTATTDAKARETSRGDGSDAG